MRRAERTYRWLAGLARGRAPSDPSHRHPRLSERIEAHANRRKVTRTALAERVDAATAALQEQRRQTLRTAEVLDMAVELLPAAARANREGYPEIWSKHRKA